MADIKNLLAWFEENNKFLDKSNTHANRVKLMKLLFLSDGIFSLKFNKSLFNSDFEAWTEGPVDNKAYAIVANKDYNSKPNYSELNDEELEVLNLVNNIYGIYSFKALSQLTHDFKSWNSVYKEDDNGIAFSHIKMNKSQIYDDFSVVVSNLDNFPTYDENEYQIEIIREVTTITKRCDDISLDLFEQFYDDIVENCDKLSKSNEFTLYIDFSPSGEIRYEL